MLQLVHFAFDWIVSGYPVERYEGHKTGYINVSQSCEYEAMLDLAKERAVKMVARSGSWSESLVTIRNLNIINIEKY